MAFRTFVCLQKWPLLFVAFRTFLDLLKWTLLACGFQNIFRPSEVALICLWLSEHLHTFWSGLLFVYGFHNIFRPSEVAFYLFMGFRTSSDLLKWPLICGFYNFLKWQMLYFVCWIFLISDEKKMTMQANIHLRIVNSWNK